MYQYSVDQWILLFFLYSFAGYLWEVAYVSLRSRKPVNRGFLFGPILPIYGFGAITILHAALPVQNNLLLTALLGGLAASILELPAKFFHFFANCFELLFSDASEFFVFFL